MDTFQLSQGKTALEHRQRFISLVSVEKYVKSAGCFRDLLYDYTVVNVPRLMYPGQYPGISWYTLDGSG